MAKFKVGDKVKVNARTTRTDIPAGTIGTIREVGSELARSEDEIIYTVDLGGRVAYLFQYKLDKTEKTMEDLTTLEKGDVLVSNSGWAPGTLTVQGVIGGIVFTLNEDSGESDHYSLAELKEDGFELQTEEVLTEVTLDDVASKFGIDVKNLRIKE